MKIRTALRSAGFSLARYSGLKAASFGPLHRVRGVYRICGGQSSVHSGVVARLSEIGALEVGPSMAVITQQGRQLLSNLEGRR